MVRTRFALVIFAISIASLFPGQAFAGEAASDERMAWWHDAKFGMFIHWGVYAVPAGVYEGEPVDGIGEWIMYRARIPVSTYKEYAKGFNPTKYDPHAWAELAEQAGMKYVVITSKHHDGFALYDSAVTDWDIADASPYGKDVLGPLADAVRKRGLKFGLYYSQAQDWVHPGGAKSGLHEGDGWDDAHKGDFDAYLNNIAKPQTAEILARFQPDVLWWDTPSWMTPERAKPFHNLLADYPHIITNNRLGGNYSGDTQTPEQYIPPAGLPGNWETCMTLNNTWGYKSTDQNWKSVETLIRNLVDIISKGGNYLLNVGPTADGEIPQESIDRLGAVGKWVKANGEAIYGTTKSPCRSPSWGRLTQKGDRVFLFVFDWPTDRELIVPIHADVDECHLLADPSRHFTSTAHDEGLTIKLTGDAPDAICSVIVLKVAGEVEGVLPVVQQGENGTIELGALDAVYQGDRIRVQQIDGKASIGYWTDPADSIEWNCNLATGGEFLVTAELATPAESHFSIQSADAQTKASVASTGSYEDFQTVELGRIELSASGKVAISIQPDPNHWQPINLRRLELRPIQ